MAGKRRGKVAVARNPVAKATARDLAKSDGTVYRHIRTDFLIGLLVTLALLGIKLLLERNPVGEQLDLFGYHWLQNRLAANFQGDDFPLQIVDISNLRAVPIAGAPTPVTPRDRLFKLIEAIVAQRPVAVGVDIDFSPTRQGYRDPQNDPWFFQSIAELRKRSGIPVFLGIADNAGLPPRDWLPEEYAGLGACILVPSGDDRRMVKWIQPRGSEPGPTLSGALAAHRQGRRSEKHLWGWAFQESAVKKLSDGISVDEFTVDYSPLKTLEHDKLFTISPQSVAEEGSRFEKKIVLVGDATLGKTSGGDSFTIPGRPWEIYAGIYIHACATYTLLRDPLYELTASGRIFLDLGISLFALWPVFAIRHYYAKMTNRTVAVARVQMFFTWLVAIVTFFGGLWLVASWGILWSDFLVVVAFLLIHPAIERYLDRVWIWARKGIPAAWDGLVFGKSAKDG